MLLSSTEPQLPSRSCIDLHQDRRMQPRHTGLQPLVLKLWHRARRGHAAQKSNNSSATVAIHTMVIRLFSAHGPAPYANDIMDISVCRLSMWVKRYETNIKCLAHNPTTI
jgi:hypothetical protein